MHYVHITITDCVCYTQDAAPWQKVWGRELTNEVIEQTWNQGMWNDYGQALSKIFAS